MKRFFLTLGLLNFLGYSADVSLTQPKDLSITPKKVAVVMLEEAEKDVVSTDTIHTIYGGEYLQTTIGILNPSHKPYVPHGQR